MAIALIVYAYFSKQLIKVTLTCEGKPDDTVGVKTGRRLCHHLLVPLI